MRGGTGDQLAKLKREAERVGVEPREPDRLAVTRVFEETAEHAALARRSQRDGVRLAVGAQQHQSLLVALSRPHRARSTDGWCAIFAALRDKIESWELSGQGIHAEIAKVLARVCLGQRLLKNKKEITVFS